jgi:hypothetical protein
MADLPKAISAYLAARSRHAKAERLMARSERILDKLLSRGVDENRAYKLAGVDLADERSVRAYGKMWQARLLLIEALVGARSMDRLRAVAAVACASLPKPANDNSLGRGPEYFRATRKFENQ